MRYVYALLTVSIVAAAPLVANDRVGRDLIIPIAGRVNGWTTDLVITNVATSGAPIEVGFNVPGVLRSFVSVTLAAGQTRTLRDVLKPYESGIAHTPISYIRLAAAEPNAMLLAWARIHKMGVSQVVNAIPVASFGKKAFLSSISGGAGTHTNAGVVINGDSDFVVTLLDSSGTARASRHVNDEDSSGPHFFNVYAMFGLDAQEGDALLFESNDALTAFASIVDETTGDADLIQSAAIDVAPNEIAPPPCAAPAPLQLTPWPASGFIVVFARGADVSTRTNELAAKYGFTVIHIYTAVLGGFFAQLTPQQLAAVRCESDVASVSENSIGYVLAD
ncbi:MAG: protease inhibitor I9 family protein [Thermoanaerobaculia bacterium]